MSIDRTLLFRLATSTRFERAVRTLPAGETAAWRQAARYVAGTTEDDGLRTARALAERGVGSSLDIFGEMVTDPVAADQVAARFVDLAVRLGQEPDAVWLSVDLSHLGLDVDPERCREHVTAIAAALPAGRRLQVGAEDHERSQAVLDCVTAVAQAGLADRLGATVQANLRRSPGDLDRLAAAGVQIRLVKGAYVEPAEHAVRYGEPTNLAYLALARRAAERGADLSLATHDALLREAVFAAVGPRPVEHLLGVRPEIVDQLIERGLPVRV
jgi:proline dehydrogenase